MKETEKLEIECEKSFTAAAVSTASKAGQWIKSRMGGFLSLQTKRSSRDLVTEIDKGAEAMIRKLLLTYYPDHAIWGEEGADIGAGRVVRTAREAKECQYVWIVDPIDGTTNFVHGFPFFSVSIALSRYGQIIAGVVYDPNRDEMFVAEKGQGAYVGGKRISVAKTAKLSESLLATGFPADTERDLPLNVRDIQMLTPKVRSIRTAGSAALQLAYVAAGRLSGFWERGLHAWDVAAGVLLVSEAGGNTSDISGAPYDLAVGDIVATNGRIHQELIRELPSAGSPA
ncbi:MAG TPA: inositol monophosphatase family protein [Bacilli bacterium]